MISAELLYQVFSYTFFCIPTQNSREESR